MADTVGKEIADAARRGVTQKTGFEKRPGWCARWVRQVLALVPRIYHPQAGPSDAKEQELVLRQKVRRVPVTDIREGDVLYWLSPSHGPHGHVAIAVGAGMVAENSTAQNYADRDARGYRRISAIGKPSAVYRFERE